MLLHRQSKHGDGARLMVPRMCILVLVCLRALVSEDVRDNDTVLVLPQSAESRKKDKAIFSRMFKPSKVRPGCNPSHTCGAGCCNMSAL